MTSSFTKDKTIKYLKNKFEQVKEKNNIKNVTIDYINWTLISEINIDSLDLKLGLFKYDDIIVCHCYEKFCNFDEQIFPNVTAVESYEYNRLLENISDYLDSFRFI